MSLLQKIQQNLQAAAAPVGVSGITEEARRLMQAKSGKAVGPQQAAVSNQAELAGLSELNAQLDQQRGVGQMQALQLGQDVENLKAQEENARRGMNLQQRAADQQFAQQESTLLQKSTQSKAELAMEREKSQADQRAHIRAFQDKQYLDTLNREGLKRRLDNEIQMKKALAKTALGNSEQLLRAVLRNQELMALDAVDFKRLIANIDLNTARDLANDAIKTGKAAAGYTAAAGIASAGIKAAGDMDAESDSNINSGTTVAEGVDHTQSSSSSSGGMIA